MQFSPHFKRSEFQCKCGCGLDTVDHELMTVLEFLRFNFGQPVIVNSGIRCENHNKSIGGASNSQHLYGKAADVVVKGVSSSKVQEYLEGSYPNKYGIGKYDDFTHIDVRPIKGRW